jgi:hypothetical protein
MSLTDTQLALLSSASREDQVVTLPPNLKGGAAKKVVGKLLSLGLAKEVVIKSNQPIWRTDENERPVGLKITRAGLNALGVESDEADEADAQEGPPKKRSHNSPASEPRAPRADATRDPARARSRRSSSHS